MPNADRIESPFRKPDLGQLEVTAFQNVDALRKWETCEM